VLFVQASIKALEQNLAVIEQAAIEKAAKYLSSSVFRDFYGVGGSAQVARDAAFKFLRIGVRASVFDDSQMMLMSACLLAQESDVVLCPNVEESLITGENAAARIAQLNIVDALFLAVAQKSSGIAERNLRRTTSAVRGQRNVW
jgi:DNA-binding MurR/RpiR family transcriptional regulator